MTEVERNCPDYPFGSEGQRASELIEMLKKAMPENKEEKKALEAKLTARKSTPADLEQAYMDIPLIVAYYARLKDEIDGSGFSAFGSLSTNKSLLDEVKDCCTKNLKPIVMHQIENLYCIDYPKEKERLENEQKKKAEESEQLLSCVEIADKELARRKSRFCDIAGSSLEYTERDEAGNDTEKSKELGYCKKEAGAADENPSKVPPQGASARIAWWSTELIRKFKAMGVTDERGKKSIIPCDSFTVSFNVVYAYALDIEHTINEITKAEKKEDSQFKKELDTAWKEWINATYIYIKQYMEDKQRKDASATADANLKAFQEKWEDKYVRDAQDVEAVGGELCE